ncbi:hypothetical protein BDV39DRAFT_166806 [Aspergillus sergii]|uniref:Uncharacterized protein n=1 Tax=Aspergillus sergii TaxID=1034303 RepID=A0A5N6XHU9_9EURO|nr:hypothetical protein BDV39DRAFT_166806 [Aspergillus sergii]
MGAKVTTSFLEEYIFIDGIKELMQETGNFVWEDSVEIPSYTYWTPLLPEIFKKQHGYAITPYLMLLSGNEGYQAGNQGPIHFFSDGDDQGSGFVADYRSTMTGLLMEYLEYLNNWTHETLGLKFSQQVGYNLPVDMLEAIPSVDIPETETLSFSNLIDGFRQFSGPANLAGKNVISIELGADFGQAYYQTWTELLQEAKHAFVAGVNQLVIHGATYSHTYDNTTWPGFTSFYYSFASQHSRHQPAWDVGYKQAMDYLARCQFILQEGVAKVDLVFWDKQTAQDAYPGILYEPTDLQDAGYTYEYLSPENFDVPMAYVKNGVLAPQQQAFKTMILRGNDTLTVAGVKALVKYAKSGFPIILSGGLSSTWASNDEQAILQSEKALKGILHLDNVHQVPYGGLVDIIQKIGIVPRSTTDCNGTWYTRWKETTDGDVYVYVYNDGAFSTGNISFQTTGSPFALNAWTGEETPITEYSVSQGRTTISFSLQSTETRIVKFSASRNSVGNESHVIWSSNSVLGYYVDSGKVWAKAAASDSATSVKLSSGKTVTLDQQGQSQFSLGNWSVVIEQWLPPDNLYDVETVANKKNLSLSVSGSNLSSWKDLGYQNASGVAYYTSSFFWPKKETGATGAYLVIPPVSHGIIISINGNEIPAVDITNPTTDVSTYLVQGDNTVVLTVSSTLHNCLIPIWDQLLTGGAAPMLNYSALEEMGFHPQEYGILGEVQVVPYQLMRII